MMGTELFPAFFTGIFLVVVLAAIMSTVDSLLILASSAVVRDVIQKTFNPPWTDKVFSRWGKLTTVVIGAVAVALALQEVRVIFWFVLFAWSGLASAFTPVAHEQPPAVEAESVPSSLPEARRRWAEHRRLHYPAPSDRPDSHPPAADRDGAPPLARAAAALDFSPHRHLGVSRSPPPPDPWVRGLLGCARAGWWPWPCLIPAARLARGC